MLLHKGLTHAFIKKPRLHFGKSFTLTMSVSHCKVFCNSGFVFVSGLHSLILCYFSTLLFVRNKNQVTEIRGTYEFIGKPKENCLKYTEERNIADTKM